MPTVVYLHGFLSSPKSAKAQLAERWLAQHRPQWQYLCPELSSYPKTARSQIRDLADRLADDATLLIGSSLGGFWATYWAEQLGVEAVVLVNPAVAPHTRFKHFIGQALPSFYGDEVVTLQPADLDVLCECDQEEIKEPSKYRVMLQTGDETLDYRDAERRYRSTDLLIEQGGNHSFEKFDRHLERIASFFANSSLKISSISNDRLT